MLGAKREREQARSRSRSRSREREPQRRRRSRSRDREREREREREQDRADQAAYSKAADDEANRKSRMDMLKRMRGADVDDELGEQQGGPQQPDSLEDLSEEQKMAALMGFGSFDTTKGKQVADNVKTAARGHVAKHKKRQYRQYMNRRIGQRADSHRGGGGSVGRSRGGSGRF